MRIRELDGERAAERRKPVRLASQHVFAVIAMPPKKNKAAKKAGKEDAPKRRFVEEPEEEEIQYDSDGNEIVKDLKKVDLNADEDEDGASSSAPGKLSAREIQKLKKKKQKGLLTDEELAKYAEYLGVEERYVLFELVCL